MQTNHPGTSSIETLYLDTPLILSAGQGNLLQVEGCLLAGDKVLGKRKGMPMQTTAVHAAVIFLNSAKNSKRLNEEQKQRAENITLAMISVLMEQAKKEIEAKDKEEQASQNIQSFESYQALAMSQSIEALLEKLTKLFNESFINVFGDTPMHLAAKFGLTKVMKLLANHGLSYNYANTVTGHTALLYAAQYADPQTLEFLVQEGTLTPASLRTQRLGPQEEDALDLAIPKKDNNFQDKKHDTNANVIWLLEYYARYDIPLHNMYGKDGSVRERIYNTGELHLIAAYEKYNKGASEIKEVGEEGQNALVGVSNRNLNKNNGLAEKKSIAFEFATLFAHQERVMSNTRNNTNVAPNTNINQLAITDSSASVQTQGKKRKREKERKDEAMEKPRTELAKK